MSPDAIFLSNGPGDPAACSEAIACVSKLLTTHLPIFGICLGFQILALSLGAKSYKMKFGHHGANHPVATTGSDKKVLISSQNHGFAIDEQSLPADAIITHRSLFDGSLQGFRYKKIMGFQGHPEAAPGPNDLKFMFKDFYQLSLETLPH
jgi:carbamoyl-phosphate synthase small subunit